MANPILESSLNIILNTNVVTFLVRNKKVDKFQLCLKTVASLFPLKWVTFLIEFPDCFKDRFTLGFETGMSRINI
jgi:hypothetical protein